MSDLKTPLCIECGSHEVRFDAEFGYYKCESCSTFWASDEDDPDYDELDDDFEYDADTDLYRVSGGPWQPRNPKNA